MYMFANNGENVAPIEAPQVLMKNGPLNKKIIVSTETQQLLASFVSLSMKCLLVGLQHVWWLVYIQVKWIPRAVDGSPPQNPNLSPSAPIPATIRW